MGLVVFRPEGMETMEQTRGGGAEWGFLHALVTGDLDTILDQSSECLLITVWGSGSAPTRVPRSGLGQWFRARDALTDEGVRTRVLGTTDAAGTTVALLLHSLERQGRARTYESVDRWTFRAGEAVAWFSRPVDPRQYADAWGLRCPQKGVHTVHDSLGKLKVGDVAAYDTRASANGRERTGVSPGDDLDVVQDGGHSV
jgi:hypothetical protein